MALRQDEPVAVGVARVVRAEDIRVERGDDVSDGERRADMADPGAHRLLEDDPADASCEGMQVVRVDG